MQEKEQETKATLLDQTIINSSIQLRLLNFLASEQIEEQHKQQLLDFANKYAASFNENEEIEPLIQLTDKITNTTIKDYNSLLKNTAMYFNFETDLTFKKTELHLKIEHVRSWHSVLMNNKPCDQLLDYSLQRLTKNINYYSSVYYGSFYNQENGKKTEQENTKIDLEEIPEIVEDIRQIEFSRADYIAAITKANETKNKKLIKDELLNAIEDSKRINIQLKKQEETLIFSIIDTAFYDQAKGKVIINFNEEFIKFLLLTNFRKPHLDIELNSNNPNTRKVARYITEQINSKRKEETIIIYYSQIYAITKDIETYQNLESFKKALSDNIEKLSNKPNYSDIEKRKLKKIIDDITESIKQDPTITITQILTKEKQPYFLKWLLNNKIEIKIKARKKTRQEKQSQLYEQELQARKTKNYNRFGKRFVDPPEWYGQEQEKPQEKNISQQDDITEFFNN